MEAKLLLIPWIAAVIYSSIPLFWFAIHPFAERWRKMNRSPYRALLPLWLLMIVGLGWCTWPWHSQQIYSTSWTWIPALVFFSFGVRVYRRISSDFGAHKLSGEAELRPDEHAQELVTTGLHTRLRHPIYLAHLCNLAGWSVGSGLMIDYVLLALNVLVTFPVMIYMEERELEARFGEAFKKYQTRVPIIPWLRFRNSGSDGRGLKGNTHEQTAAR
jgi:protein-S-isoprenylcysteine O-methyltransferase Ste14